MNQPLEKACDLDFRAVEFENGGLFAAVACRTCRDYHEHWLNRATYYRPDKYDHWGKPTPYVRSRACCYYCGIGDSDGAGWLRVDHIIPRSKGGTNGNYIQHPLSGSGYYENLVFCCKFCNSIKGTKSIEEARPKLMKRRVELANYKFPADPTCLAFEEGHPFPETI